VADRAEFALVHLVAGWVVHAREGVCWGRIIGGRKAMAESEILQEDRALDGVPFLELGEKGILSRDVKEFASYVVPWIASVVHPSATFVYISLQPPVSSCFRQYGMTKSEESEVKRACGALMERPSVSPGAKDMVQESLSHFAGEWRLLPLESEHGPRGFMGMKPLSSPSVAGPILPILARFLGHVVETILDRIKTARQISYFNTYLTVSSLLAKPIGLHELMESVLYFCTEVVSSEEASVLLLDDDRTNFRFYQTEGPSRSLLTGESFPVSVGIAGSVLRSRQPEIIDDVQNDPRFYGRFDSKSGVLTRNMIVIPLVAENEPVGVLEVINKVGGLDFTDEDRLLLHFIADEIAFAVRNARIFEVVVDSYCKQRQGQNSCKGCKRPLGSWTPCVRYREAIGV